MIKLWSQRHPYQRITLLSDQAPLPIHVTETTNSMCGYAHSVEYRVLVERAFLTRICTVGVWKQSQNPFWTDDSGLFLGEFDFAPPRAGV